jgi:hypothetical protein
MTMWRMPREPSGRIALEALAAAGVSRSVPVTAAEIMDSFCWPYVRHQSRPGELRTAVLDLYPAGVVTEPFRVEVLIAARP